MEKPYHFPIFSEKRWSYIFILRIIRPVAHVRHAHLRGAYGEFKNKNIEVVGISKDSVASHVKFAEKYNLPFILLSDPELEAIKAYGVWQEKKLYEKVSMGVVRTTFIIDENGNVEKIMPKVKPDTNAAEILAEL